MTVKHESKPHPLHGMGIFDIETGQGDPKLILDLAKPFPDFQPLGEFDPSQVKLGNLKDEGKIQEKIQAAQEKHEADAAAALAKWESDRQEYEENLITRSPLDPMVGVVLAIGILKDDGTTMILGDQDEPEEMILASFWEWIGEMIQMGCPFISWNGDGFDLPFLLKRSWLLGVDPFPGILDDSGRYWHRLHIDLMKKWGCGKFGRDAWAALDTVAQAFGFKGKAKDEVTGENFHHHWAQGGKPRQKAVEYLKADLVATRQLAERILGHPGRISVAG